MIAPELGTEFVPRLSEGAIVINVVRLAGTDLDESVRYNTQMEKALLADVPRRGRSMSGAASAPPRWPPIRWAWN